MIIKKEAVTNIINGAIYTDFLGLSGTQPNGLIQTEINRRFFLNRRVWQLRNTYNYIGFLNSIKPSITLSKIENDNKILELKTQTLNNDSSLQRYTGYIDILKHAKWMSGGDFNIFYLGIPRFQSMIYINIGVDILNVSMRLPESDTTLTFNDIKIDENREFNKSFIDLYPEIHWTISPHPRFQIDYNIKYCWLLNLSKDFILLSNPMPEYLQNGHQAKSFTNIIKLRFLAALRLSDNTNNNLFFRSIYTFIPEVPAQNYFQAQLGFAFNIFNRKVEPPPFKPFEGL